MRSETRPATAAASAGDSRATGSLVEQGPVERRAPYKYEAQPETEDFFSWLDANRDHVEQHLRLWGAVLFRGFGLADRAKFDRLLSALCRKVIAGYGDLPPEEGTDRVYASTPYPAGRWILFHNESSHMASWPTRQFFACVTASPVGGETPIVDCRRIYRRLDEGVRQRFAEEGLLYIRHFVPGVDISWQAFFKTDDRAEVERICTARRARWEWKSDDVLMVVQPARAVAQNPVTGEWSFFNQIMLHHPSFLPDEDREALETVVGASRMPRQVKYGDGTDIEDNVLRSIHNLYMDEASSFAWKPGDALMLDNMSIAHARSPFKGPRKIIVGMGDPIEMWD